MWFDKSPIDIWSHGQILITEWMAKSISQSWFCEKQSIWKVGHQEESSN
jgi:hypothetical protein